MPRPLPATQGDTKTVTVVFLTLLALVAFAANSMLAYALASGLGYVIWYAALKHLQTSTAAVSQLTVPVITAVLGILLLAEPLTPRVLVSGLAILTGIALVTAFQSKKTD